MIEAYLTTTYWKDKEKIKKHYGEVLSRYNPDYESDKKFVIIEIKDIDDLIELSEQCQEEVIVSTRSNFSYKYLFNAEESIKEDKLKNIVIEIYDYFRE